jgi:hypothetical protein
LLEAKDWVFVMQADAEAREKVLNGNNIGHHEESGFIGFQEKHKVASDLSYSPGYLFVERFYEIG